MTPHPRLLASLAIVSLLEIAAHAQINTFPASGNVGIGTSNPAAKLDVAGSVRLAGGAYLSDQANSGPYVDAGNTGFRGTHTLYTTPWGPGQVGASYGVTWDGTQGRWEYAIGSGSTYGGALLFNQTTGSLLFYSTGSNSGANGDNAQSYMNVKLLVDNGGNVGIGTINPTHKLAVNGTIKAKEIIVEATGWSDYVFSDDYRLAPLADVEAHIKINKHLPGIPSAAQAAEQGVSVGDMQARLLAKIEELTLHLIAQEKELSRLRGTEKRLAALETKLQQLH